MKSQILFLIMGLSVGALAVAVLRSSGPTAEESAKQELAEAQAKISELEQQKAKALEDAEKSKALASKAVMQPVSELNKSPDENDTAAKLDDATPEPAEDDPAAQFAKLFNSKEARSLMKQFSGAAVNMMEKRAGDEIAKYKDKYQLTDDQMSTLQAKLSEKLKEGTEKFTSSLDNENKSVQEIMQEQGQNWRNQEEEIAGIMKETLTEEQYGDFEHDMLAERAQRVERNSSRQLNRLDSQLNLDETQKDQVFGILVENSPDYDSAMKVEGASVTPAESLTPAVPATPAVGEGDLTGAAGGAFAGEIPEGAEALAGAAEISQEDAIRTVLTPEQLEIYNKSLEQGGDGGRGNPLGGFGFGR
jgi:transcriptional regulator